jgi:hypothetical protein
MQNGKINNMEDNNYCVYRHIRLDTNQVFYIGMGNLKRPLCRYSRNRYWNHITNQTEWFSEVIMDGLTLKEAHQKEIEFISIYGRKDLGLGTLCNLTDGGTGGLGLKHTNDSKTKMKGRVSHNKNKSKYNHIQNRILECIKIGYSERQISLLFNISKGAIHRIKLKWKDK